MRTIFVSGTTATTYLLVRGFSGRTPLEFLPFSPQESPVGQVSLLPTGWHLRASPLGKMKSFGHAHSSETTEPGSWTVNTSTLHPCTTLLLIVRGYYYRYSPPFKWATRISFVLLLILTSWAFAELLRRSVATLSFCRLNGARFCRFCPFAEAIRRGVCKQKRSSGNP